MPKRYARICKAFNDRKYTNKPYNNVGRVGTAQNAAPITSTAIINHNKTDFTNYKSEREILTKLISTYNPQKLAYKSSSDVRWMCVCEYNTEVVVVGESQCAYL